MFIIGLKKQKNQKQSNVQEHFKECEIDEIYWFVGKKGTSKTRENVYIIIMISRNLRQIVGFDKSPERIQKIVDNSPTADFYYTNDMI